MDKALLIFWNAPDLAQFRRGIARKSGEKLVKMLVFRQTKPRVISCNPFELHGLTTFRLGSF